MLLTSLLYSLFRLAIGYGAASLVGIVLGVLLGYCEFGFVRSILDILISMPTLVWVPIFLLWFGLGDATVIAAVFLGAIFVVARNTEVGITLVPQEQVEAARLDGAGDLALIWSVLLPGAMGSVRAGLRLGIAYGWRALIGAEMLAALVQKGIGKMIYQARFWNDTKTMLWGLITIAICGMAMDRVLSQGEK